MEKLVELFKNKKFMYIFSGFIALIGLIIILKPKGEKTPEKDDSEELKNMIKETNKTVKLIKKKNEELEKNSHGKSIVKSDSPGKSNKVNEPGNEKGKGKTAGKQDEPVNDEPNDDEDEPTE